MAITTDPTINYEDERLTKVETKESEALTQNEQMYNGMISNTDKYYDDLKQHTQDTADKQAQIQQEKTDFAIEQIEQQKDKAHKDYLKEQSGAYVDWRKQSNQYGTEAEKMASSGLSNTGYSESSQVGMYNTYQNRLATARESYNNAVLNYNNAIKDAMLQNNAALAEIAANALEKQLELSLQGFQYKNQLIVDQANKKLEIENMYHSQYMDVLQQLNTENALKVDIEKYNDNQKWQTEQAELDRNFQLKRDEINNKFAADQAELERKHDKEMLEAETAKKKELLEIEHQKAMEKLEQEHKNDLAILEQEYQYSKKLKSSSGNSSSGSNSGGNGGGYVAINKNGIGTLASDAVAAVNGSKGNYPIDYDSLTAIGLSGVSPAKLHKLVQSGEVIQYTQNGKTKFRRSTVFERMKNWLK